jgi:hypothetical protein
LSCLQDKYANGYTVTVVLESEQAGQSVEDYILSNMSGSKLRYKGHRNLVFDLKITCSDLADVYKVLEDIPAYLSVADYTVNQNSLDNVRAWNIN